jgi:hypothetical protein
VYQNRNFKIIVPKKTEMYFETEIYCVTFPIPQFPTIAYLNVSHLFWCSNVAGFIYVTDIDIQRFVLLDFIMCLWRMIAKCCISNLNCILQKEDNVSCTICWRTSKQVFNYGILNMA